MKEEAYKWLGNIELPYGTKFAIGEDGEITRLETPSIDKYRHVTLELKNSHGEESVSLKVDAQLTYEELKEMCKRMVDADYDA